MQAKDTGPATLAGLASDLSSHFHKGRKIGDAGAFARLEAAALRRLAAQRSDSDDTRRLDPLFDLLYGSGSVPVAQAVAGILEADEAEYARDIGAARHRRFLCWDAPADLIEALLALDFGGRWSMPDLASLFVRDDPVYLDLACRSRGVRPGALLLSRLEDPIRPDLPAIPRLARTVARTLEKACRNPRLAPDIDRIAWQAACRGDLRLLLVLAALGSPRNPAAFLSARDGLAPVSRKILEQTLSSHGRLRLLGLVKTPACILAHPDPGALIGRPANAGAQPAGLTADP